MRFLLILVFGLFCTAARADGLPILQLDTGGHMAKIKSVLFTPDGKYLVSAGDDKVIRIWDWRAGKTVRTIRGEIGRGPAGQIHALALSPDGRWLASAGRMPNNEIRLFDFASGELVGLLRGHSGPVNALAFSPDGTKLISGAGIGDLSAIVWDVANKAPLSRFVGHSAPIYAVSFTLDGERAVTGSDDKTLRLWNVHNGSSLLTLTGHNAQVFAVAVSRNDGSIASADDAGEVRIWDGKTGVLRSVFTKLGFGIGSLQFSPDGKTLLTTCGGGGCADKPQILWDIKSGQQLQSFNRHDNIVLAGVFSPDGKLVATAGGDEREIYIWDAASAETKALLKGIGKPSWAAGISKDSTRIAWGNTWRQPDPARGYGPLELSLTLQGPGGLAAGAKTLAGETGFVTAESTKGTWSLRHRQAGAYNGNAALDLLKDGTVRATIMRGPEDGFQHRSYTFSPDGQTIIAGASDGWLSAYGLDGKKIGDFVGHEGDVWAVTASPDGRYLVSGASDQTVRLWNLKSRQLIVTLFYGSGGAWVMWTPQGFFASSPGGDALAGWQINQGPEREAQYVTAAQLRKRLNRPDIVARAIQLASAEAAVKEAAAAEFKVADLLTQPVPKLKITPIPTGFAASGGSTPVEITIGDTPDPVKAIRIQVNGRQVIEDVPETGGIPPGKITYTVPLAAGGNTIVVIAINDIGETVERVSVYHEGAGLLDQHGTLHILSIGVNEYPGLPGNDLNFAGADAKAFANAMEKRAGALYTKVVSRVLVNRGVPEDAPTAANILDALQRLQKVSETDTIMLFVAGHGINEGLNYRFIPTDAKWTDDGEIRASTVVPWHAFQEAVESAKGARIMFLDTCHSANAYNARALNESVHANILVYASARWDQEAQETDELGEGHGLFTLALVEGVNGKARTKAGEVRAESLSDYLARRVKALVTQLKKPPQDPQFYKGRDAENYLLAITN